MTLQNENERLYLIGQTRNAGLRAGLVIQDLQSYRYSAPRFASCANFGRRLWCRAGCRRAGLQNDCCIANRFCPSACRPLADCISGRYSKRDSCLCQFISYVLYKTAFLEWSDSDLYWTEPLFCVEITAYELATTQFQSGPVRKRHPCRGWRQWCAECCTCTSTCTGSRAAIAGGARLQSFVPADQGLDHAKPASR